MGAVGDAAQSMIEEIQDQYDHICPINPETGEREEKPEPGYPNHERCIAISTEASLSKMIAPGAIVILSPLVVGMIFGYLATAGLLSGIIVSGIQIAFSASNTGGAWDNCKKFVEAKKLVRKDGTIVKKGDFEHVAAVVGDTVGDPLKDTSGPSINILVKLSAITSLVFGTFIAKYGGKLFK